MRPAMRRACAAALLLCALGALALHPATPELLVPWQGRLLAALMPPFAPPLLHIDAGPSGARVAGTFVSAEHLVLAGRAWPPGLRFSAHTPALLPWRPLLLFAAVLPWLRRRGWWLAPLGLLAWPLLQVPLVLAGQVWGLVMHGPEPSAAWLLMQVSDALLHGGDLAVAVLLATLAMVLSDHAPAWFGRTIRAPADAGAPPPAPRRP